ncbi:hypothetical protein [Rhodococcus sp. IEGM 1379]|uniref:hypothetical protein n=1 Tax=Rhodococcus sp. IEGM 1379 TaxID=3047086 RepID=UPI0024B8416B|nr:hypothetical protein [Rhodococcus sp. IEGM 1379]MDI9915664.1 hypothetical protein [Rhodococcus sp. IEGM 1379]
MVLEEVVEGAVPIVVVLVQGKTGDVVDEPVCGHGCVGASDDQMQRHFLTRAAMFGIEIRIRIGGKVIKRPEPWCADTSHPESRCIPGAL